jgi:endoglucanase
MNRVAGWAVAIAGCFLAAGCATTDHPSFAFVPSNPLEMKPLADRNSPAYQAATLFMHGVNLGSYLETEHLSRNRLPAEKFAVIHAEGFDHVRVPVAWQQHAGPAPDYMLSSNIFARVDFVVTNALANQLAVILDVHNFEELVTNAPGQTDKLVAMWRQIAAHYADAPNTVAFDLFNEPHGPATAAVMNPIYAQLIAEIRKISPHRTLFVETGDWAKAEELKNLILPDDDNIIVALHLYDPYYFTHQGASWSGPDVRVTGIQFPGPPAAPLVPDRALKLNTWVLDWIHEYNTLPTDKNPCSPLAFLDRLKYVRQWSDYYGRPVQVGEFGCYTTADPESRARYYAAFRRALDEQHLGWGVWDWNSGFRYWDDRKNAPMPGMREALFGK